MIYLDHARKEEAVRAGWLAYQERTPGLEAAYARAAAKWNPIAVCDDEKVIGAVLERGGFIHIGIVPEYRGRWASRRIIREMLALGRKTTLMDSESDEFIKRIGFVKNGGHYELHR